MLIFSLCVVFTVGAQQMLLQYIEGGSQATDFPINEFSWQFKDTCGDLASFLPQFRRIAAADEMRRTLFPLL
jgi:hypothetical protein